LVLKLRLVIRSVSVWGHPNIRTWEPENPGKIAEIVTVDIGPKTKKHADSFTIRVATPLGLTTLQPNNGILAIRPLLIMERYNFHDLWRWLETTVAKCEDETWNGCVDRLQRYFNWEYQGYKES
jgi:hypothetical protein